jgi:DNA polymerase-3 subunit gamma/tau
MGKNVNKLVELPAAEIDQMMAQIQQVPLETLHLIFEYLYREEASIRLSSDVKLALEIAFIRMDQMEPVLPIDVLIDKLDLLKQELNNQPQGLNSSPKPIIKPETSESAPYLPAGETSAQSSAMPETAPLSGDVLKDLDAVWDQIGKIIAEKNPSLGANLAKCRLKQVTADRVEIEVHGNGFTVRMMEREKNKVILKKACARYFGTEKDIVLIAQGESDDERLKKKPQNDHLLKQKALSHPSVADALEIFNGKLIDVKIF